MKIIRSFKLTAYYAGRDEWGNTIGNPVMVSIKPQLNHLWLLLLPPGSKVLIDGIVYIEDVGRSIKRKYHRYLGRH